jgi:hypothetical protein
MFYQGFSGFSVDFGYFPWGGVWKKCRENRGFYGVLARFASVCDGVSMGFRGFSMNWSKIRVILSCFIKGFQVFRLILGTFHGVGFEKSAGKIEYLGFYGVFGAYLTF